MRNDTIFSLKFILMFLIIKLSLVTSSHSSDPYLDKTREGIITQTMADLQAEKPAQMPVSEQSLKAMPRLRPRFEANWRYSNDRSIMMGEFWMPVVQCEESVLFCDLRIMGDENDNQEFNVGTGYRQVLHNTFLGDGVAGGMVWFDRRYTENSSQFNQITVGGEWLGEQFDLRMNGYVPLDQSRTFKRANPNGAGQGFVGNQLLVNTDQVVVEETLPGLDFEAGARLNFMNDITDSTQLFLGGYHFAGDLAKDITGVRTRIVSDITSDVQLGVRFQHDAVRGSQTYFESTIRFPFGHKRKYKSKKVWARLDESPERDIDVVSNEAITEDGINKTLMNAKTGVAQNIIHVDNTAAGGGNGSKGTPYNTLAAAEAAAMTNDMIYVHAGDGTTTNQNVGITLDDAGQMLAGAGADLFYSTERFQTPNGQNVSGVMIPATTTPIITNGAGSGVLVTADDVYVTGIKASGATANGIYAFNAENIIIDNVTSNNNAAAGIRVDANAGRVNRITIINNTLDNNGAHGLYAYAVGGGDIGTATVQSNTAKNNTSYGLILQANGAGSTINTADYMNNTVAANINGIYTIGSNDGDITTVNLINNVAMNNTSYGIRAEAVNAGSTITTVNFTNNVSNNNTASGLFAYAQDNGNLGTVNFTNNVTQKNSAYGFWMYAASGADIGMVNITGNTSTSNTNYGFLSQANGAGSTITTSNFMNNTSMNNGNVGLYALAQNDADMTTVNFTDNKALSNGNFGIRAEATGVGSTITTANFTNNISNSNVGGVMVSANTSGNIGTANVTGNAASTNASGYLVLSDTNGNIGHAILANNTSTSNTSYGFYNLSQNTGSLSKLDMTNNTATSNINNGFYFYALADGDIAQVSLEDNISSNNLAHGFGINDDSTAGGIAIDLGGGAFGSTGGNSSSGNTLQELFVDLDGAELKAKSNWWGSSKGLTGSEILLEDASTVDAIPFLPVRSGQGK